MIVHFWEILDPKPTFLCGKQPVQGVIKTYDPVSGDGVVVGDTAGTHLQQVRRQLPALQHRRL